MKTSSVDSIQIIKVTAAGINKTADKVAIEEPLEIQLEYSTNTGLMVRKVSITMRTPGHDEELATGFLFTEGVMKNAEDIAAIKQPGADENITKVILKENRLPEVGNISRNFYTTSSCGICGKASIEAIHTVSQFALTKDDLQINATVFYRLQEKTKQQQKVFEDTGGIHASALFDRDGNLMMLREDVGRHNALDKIIGLAWMNGQLPLNNHILFLSGRASFELVQKAVMAGIKIVAAVGAPSSLAVEMAKENGITLIGFLRNDRLNIYSGEKRIVIA